MTWKGEGVNHGETRDRMGRAILFPVAIDIGDMNEQHGDCGATSRKKRKVMTTLISGSPRDRLFPHRSSTPNSKPTRVTRTCAKTVMVRLRVERIIPKFNLTFP